MNFRKIPWTGVFSKLSAKQTSATLLKGPSMRYFMNLNKAGGCKCSPLRSMLLTKYTSMGFRASNTLCAKDYYKTLGVDHNASKADIK